MARTHGVEGLLPFTTKGTEERIRKREEFGLRVKGTGVGQRVKGKWWERNIRVRLEKRRQAMLDMPQMVQTWKQVNVLPAAFYTDTDEISSLAMVGGGRSTQSRPLLGYMLFDGNLGLPSCTDSRGLSLCIALGIAMSGLAFTCLQPRLYVTLEAAELGGPNTVIRKALRD